MLQLQGQVGTGNAEVARLQEKYTALDVMFNAALEKQSGQTKLARDVSELLAQSEKQVVLYRDNVMLLQQGLQQARLQVGAYERCKQQIRDLRAELDAGGSGADTRCDALTGEVAEAKEARQRLESELSESREMLQQTSCNKLLKRRIQSCMTLRRDKPQVHTA